MNIRCVRICQAGAVVLVVTLALAGCGKGVSTTLPSVRPGLEVSVPAPTLATIGKSFASGVARQTSTSNPYSAAVLADHPAAYYQLNDSGSTMTDSGPSGIAGLYGSSVTHGVTTITQGSPSASGFPGGGQYKASGFAFTPPSAILQPGIVSVEAWFKMSAPAAANTYSPIVVYGKQGTSYGLYLQGLSGGVACIFYQQTNVGNPNRLLLHGLTRLSPGVIYHVVGVFDGSNVTTYVNGLFDQTVAYPGAIAYATNLTLGLQIGGQLSSSPPGGDASFPGSIAQIAIYGSVLSQSTVINHYLAGQLLPLIPHQAAPANSFVDSIGLNTHFDVSSSPYYKQFSQVATLLSASGIRHIRNNMSFNPVFISSVKQLAGLNIFGTYITNLGSTITQVQKYPSIVYPSLEQFEAPNEQDDLGGYPNWQQPCKDFQKRLYFWVKGYPGSAAYPVLGPGLAFAANFKQIGNLSWYMDVGNFHDYMGKWNPGFVGGPFGGMIAMLNDERVTSADKPVMSTESGYGTISGNPGFDFRTDLRYMTRLFFEQFNAGIVRSYSYEFIDEGGLDGSFNTFGLLNNDLSPKPAYTGLKSLIGVLADPGAPFTASSLSYAVSGLSNVHHLLMQKRNGSFVLALWIEAPGWNVLTGGDIIVPNQNVTLLTATNFSSATLAAMDENGNLGTSSLPWNGKSTTVAVSDKVSLVTLTP